MALNKAELACVYSALILVDDDVAVTVSIMIKLQILLLVVDVDLLTKLVDFWSKLCLFYLTTQSNSLRPSEVY